MEWDKCTGILPFYFRINRDWEIKQAVHLSAKYSKANFRRDKNSVTENEM